MNNLKGISAILTIAFISLVSVNVSAATYQNSVGENNFGTYIGTFIGPDNEQWFEDSFHIDVDFVATISPPSLSDGGLSIINPVFNDQGGLISGQWLYTGPGVITYLTFGRSNVFSLFEFVDGANTGFFDSTTLLNRPLEFLSVYSTPAPIPLPAAVWLLISGIVGVVGFGKRSK